MIYKLLIEISHIYSESMKIIKMVAIISIAVVGLTNCNNTETTKSPAMVRLSKIEVDTAQLESYNALLKEEIESSMNLEKGVLALYAVSEKNTPNKITILEIYENESAYQHHIKTSHFLKYKQGTLDMVLSLELIDVLPLLPELKIK